MKRPLAYVTAAWRGDPCEITEQAAKYCRAVYDAGFSPICPTLYLPLFLNDAVPEEHKSGIDMGRDLLRRSRVLVVCGGPVTEEMKNDIATAQRLGITATTLEGILTVKGQGHRRADMEGKILEAYVTNLGKYNEGRLVGAPLNFPTTTEDVQALLKRIGVDGVRYEEIFITDFESDILGLYDHLGECESIDELNHLAHLLSGMDGDALTALSIIIFVLVYGRMIEIYLLTSLAPIPVATLSNRELGGTGQNYLKSLFAVAFQGMLILVCVAIYAVLIQGIATSGDPIGAIWGTIGYTVLLCFMLFKTGGIAQRVFGAH